MASHSDPAAIIAELRHRRVPHAQIADALGRDRSAATKLLSGKREMKAREIAPLMALLRKAA